MSRGTGEVWTDEWIFWCGGSGDGDRGDQRGSVTDSLLLVDLSNGMTDYDEQHTLTKCRGWEQQGLRRRDDDRQQRLPDLSGAAVDRWSSAVWFVRGELTGRRTDLFVRASTECHVAWTDWEIRPTLAGRYVRLDDPLVTKRRIAKTENGGGSWNFEGRLIEAPIVVRYGGGSPGGAALAFNSWEL